MVTYRRERRDKQIHREHPGGEDKEDTEVIIICVPFVLQMHPWTVSVLSRTPKESADGYMDTHLA